MQTKWKKEICVLDVFKKIRNQKFEKGRSYDYEGMLVDGDIEMRWGS